jgi:MYXO-CTERM domain-containing protein
LYSRLIWAERRLLIVGALALTLPAGVVRANGAFPGSLRVFTPPGEVLLATNFGLISSGDGARWDWVCEHGDALFASLYELESGENPRLYAAGVLGLAVSADRGCSWTASSEMVAASITGMFADPAASGRVWVVARTRNVGPGDGPGLYLSTDGGLSFGPPRYRVPLGSSIDSVESARSRPERLYLTVTHAGSPARIEVVRSDDGAATFTTFDLSAATGGDQLRIAAVDPVDPDHLYLREQGFPDERLMISADGGQTLTEALLVPRGRLAAFVRRADGTLVAATLSDLNGPGIHLSRDGGRSFELRPSAIHAGALAEREGVLYASTDNFLDGFALARSSDGRDWEPLTRYGDVAGTRACPAGARIAQTCAALCIEQVVRGVFSEQTCGSVRLPTPPPDAGPPTAPAGTGGGGCGCRIDGGQTPPAPLALLLLAVVTSLRWGQRVVGRSGRGAR